MGIYIMNKTRTLVTIKDYFVNNPITGLGYYGGTCYVLSPDGQKLIDHSTFTRQTINETRMLEIHVLIDGMKHLVLQHWDFEINKGIVFMMEGDKLVAKVVPKEAERGFAGKIWDVLHYWVTDASIINALIATAEQGNSVP